MFELTIKDVVYEFNFGMGFLHEINKKVQTAVDGVKDVKKNIGLRYMIASVIDGDLEALEDILFIANMGKNPRVTRALLDSYLEDENTDIDKLFDDVMGFLKSANATKKTTMELLEAVAKEMQKAES